MKAHYTPPTLTVDGVIFQLEDTDLCVLLIRRANEPFKNTYALPGGYNPEGETTFEALGRVLNKKAGIFTGDLGFVEQLYAFDTVARDPRGHAVSVAYMGLGKKLQPKTTTTTESPEFYPINSLPPLAYDHEDIIKYAHERLKNKIGYTNAIFALLPQRFTLSQLQSAYEAVFCRALDKRNFRKKFLSLDLISATSEYRLEGAHRPAQLYAFKSQVFQELPRTFE